MKNPLYRALAVFALGSGLYAANPVFSVTAPKNVIGADDDLIVTLTTTNPTDETIWFGDFDYDLDLRDSAGNKVPYSAHMARMKNGVPVNRGMPYPLSAHGERTERVNLSDLFNIPGAGTYTLTVSIPNKLLAPLVFTILPALPPASAAEAPALKAASVASSGPQRGVLSLYIEADRPNLLVNAPIHLRAVLSNHSADTIPVPFDSNGGAFIVAVRGPSGALIPDSDAIRMRKAAADNPAALPLPRIPLRPGSSISAEVELNTLADMKSSGTYNVQLCLHIPESLGGGEIWSNLISLSVRARQPSQ